MTVVVDNLAHCGLVERIPSKEDRRAIVVRLTKKGKKLFGDIFMKHAEFVTSTVGVLSQEEQTDLGTLLKKLGRGLNSGN